MLNVKTMFVPVYIITTVDLLPLLQNLGLLIVKALKPETHTLWSADTFKGESHSKIMTSVSGEKCEGARAEQMWIRINL